MKVRGKYLHHESSDYDFQDESSGRRVQGVSHKLALLPDGQFPMLVKLTDDAMQRFARSGIKQFAEVEITYEVRAGRGGQPQLGKVIDVSPVRVQAA